MPTADRYQQYEILRRQDGSFWELGRGAMGITYKAYDTNLRFPVALKVINSAYLDSDTARQRFLREARAAAALRHPNVASVFNLGTVQENYFYVMEFIDGETLEARVNREGPVKPVEALNIALQVARALAVAARQQLVHRDLKPTNLMLVDQEGELIVKVIDFGLAKVTKDTGEDSAALTLGGFVGTPHFASPEQVEDGDIDIRSDIYSLGATLYFVLTGQSPFSGSVGQIMSQHLYKPLPIEPLRGSPECVASLVQRMMEKDRNARPQTPQELQKEILACLDKIRGLATEGGRATAQPVNPSETLDLSVASSQPLAPGVTVAQVYKLIEEIGDSPGGRRFLAEDLLHNRKVSLLVLSPNALDDKSSLTSLRETVNLARKAPHPMLREVYSFETYTDCGLVAEEHVTGASLLDLLRARGALTAPELIRLLGLLAPVADHASKHGLRHVDFTLSGIHFVSRQSGDEQSQSQVLRRPLTAWESLHLKVNAIDFGFLPALNATVSGMVTLMQSAAPGGSEESSVRLLSLLAYELLGGPRARLDATGHYTPVASLTQEGNAVLRRGVIDEYNTVGELVRNLEATARASPASARASESAARTPSHTGGTRTPPEIPAAPSIKSRPKAVAWVLALASFVMLLVAVGIFLIRPPAPIEVVPVFSVQTKPPGAAILLDNKPPAVPPNTFTDVPIGTHQLSVTLDGYEPIKQNLEVRKGIAPEVRLQLKPIPEIPALSIQTEPAGASVLLDDKGPQAPPNTFTHVPFGTHQLSVTLDGYEPIKQDLQVRRGMAPEVRLQLKPIPEIPTLSIQTEPAGATVLLDDKGPQAPPNTFTHVPFGMHQLSVTLDGYEPIEQDLQVRRGMAPEVRLQLKPILEIPTLAIQTEPDGASIRLDDKPPQVAPNTFTHVPFGTHQLSVTLDGYEPIKQDVEVRSGMEPELQLQLKPSQETVSEAFQVFLRDAQLGDTTAMMKVGLLYLRRGTSDDDATGFSWLNRAYNAPKHDPETGVYVADCYLSGKGTTQDLPKAEEIDMPLANQNVPRAMTLAGRILQIKGIIKRTDAAGSSSPKAQKQLLAQADELDRQARRWWERAEKDDWNASAHLGKCYEEGWGGLEKSEEQAEKRYKAGADHGNPLSMLFYGLLIDKKPGRHIDAVNFISRAAAAGIPSAIKWCKDNNVTFTEQKSVDDHP